VQRPTHLAAATVLLLLMLMAGATMMMMMTMLNPRYIITVHMTKGHLHSKSLWAPASAAMRWPWLSMMMVGLHT